MQLGLDPPVSDEDCPLEAQRASFVCDNCGKSFEKPVFAKIITGNQTQKYYACPWCITKIHQIETPKSNVEKAEAQIPVKETNKQAAERQSNAACQHFFGYLNKRRKDTPIPDECLTCNKMVECMIQ